MEPNSTVADRSPSKSAIKPAILGQLESLDGQGQVLQTWKISQPRCTVGSTHESLVCIDDSSMAPLHAMIAFGKNHTLIRAMGGQVRIAGRSVREWLIDEPTMIQCGAARLVVYPLGYLRSASSPGHRVSSGTVVDQAARLRSLSSPDVTIASESRLAEHPTTLASPTQTDATTAAPAAAVVVAKLDPVDVQTALEPLHQAVQAASDGILELTKRASESASQWADRAPANNHLVEVTQAIETLETRFSNITHYCENLLANVAETIDGRMSRLDEFLEKLAQPSTSFEPTAALECPGDENQESPVNTAIDEDTARAEWKASLRRPRPQEDDSYSPSCDAPNFEAEPDVDPIPLMPEPSSSHSYFANLPLADAVMSDSHYDAKDLVAPKKQTYEEADSYTSAPTAPQLPSWFTQDEVETARQAEDELTPVAEVEAEAASTAEPAWSTVELNPIYAEDSNRWLEEVEAPAAAPAPAMPSDVSELLESIQYRPELPTFESDDAVAIRTGYDEPSVDEIISAYAGVDEEESVPQAPVLRYVEEPEADEEPFAEQDELTSFESQLAVNETAPENSDDDREESIEDYMARLLQRVKGGTEPDEPPSKRPTTTSKLRDSIAMPSSPMDSKRDSTTARIEPLSMDSAKPVVEKKSADFAPRQNPPERVANLAALRDLANDTARQALHTSSRRKIELNLVSKIGISVFGFSGSILLLVLNGFRANVAMIGMIASLVVGLLWGYEAIMQIKQLQVAKAKEASDNQAT